MKKKYILSIHSSYKVSEFGVCGGGGGGGGGEGGRRLHALQTMASRRQ